MDAHVITYALALGAILRLSRLVVDDDLTAPAREALHRRVHYIAAPGHRTATFVARLTACTWCVSIWISIGVTAAAYWAGDSPWFRYPALVLTLSWFTGIIASWLDSPPPVRHVVHHTPDTASVRVISHLADVPGQTAS